MSQPICNYFKTNNLYISKEYITFYTCDNHSKQICDIILKYIDCNNTITDCNAGIGGNAYYFCKYFNYVYAIDNNEHCMKYLEHNLFDYDNKYIIEYNCLDILKIIRTDIVFFDPPWGGKDYKKNDSLDLLLNNLSINEIIDNLYNTTKLIALKAPNNYLIHKSTVWKMTEYPILKNYNTDIVFKLLIYSK